MSDVFGEHKDSVSRSEDLEKVEENEVKQVTMGQKDLGPMVRCLSFKYDRKPLVQHLTLLTFYPWYHMNSPFQVYAAYFKLLIV